jgi:hypothetical protein
MEFQILNTFPIQSQPRFDVRVLGISSRGIRIALLNFSGAFVSDVRKDGLKRKTKNRALSSTPTALIGQWLRKFEDLSGKLHLKIDEL